MKRFPAMAPSLALLGSAILITCCGGGGGKETGDFCETTADCRGDLVCENNVCVEPEQTPCEPACNPEVEICHQGVCVIIADANDKDSDGSPAVDDCDDTDRRVHPDAFEYCDGMDNDCDGSSDEGCPACDSGDSRSCGTDVGECTQGEQTCENGTWSACSGLGPIPEACDELDNDCDGRTDENCPCTDGTELDCGLDEGQCSAGVEICAEGVWPGCLNGQVPAEAEVCDGLDNDCDGFIDDGFEIGLACSAPGECGAGILECAGDYETGCSSAPGGSADASTAELCNSLDDDCDGETDEDFSEVGQPCDGDDEDQCALGTWTCAADGSASECVNEERTDLVEVCNGEDDDCDGDTDEGYDGLGEPCDTDDTDLCPNGVYTCTANTAGIECASEAVVDIVETCNGVDDDCDGDTDEGLDTDSDGDGHFAQGSCAQPADDCDDADANNFPGNTEVCDNQDNDCDGQVDEGFDVDGDGYTTCDLPVPDCNDNNNAVNPGATEVCTSPARDDDCDGLTDAADPSLLTPPCNQQFGVCQGAHFRRASCINGTWPPACGDSDYLAYTDDYINPAQAPVHACSDPAGHGEGLYAADCDSLDNDCDGTTDEAISCDGDQSPVCSQVTHGEVADCCDTDASAYPGQTSYIAHARDGCGGYDYDCDGTETRHPDFDHLFECVYFGGNCSVTQDGFVDSIPDCGAQGEFAQFCTTFVMECHALPAGTVTMACR